MNMQLSALILYSLALVAIAWRYSRRKPSAETFGIDDRTSSATGVFASTITLIGGGELLVVASLAFVSDGAAITLLTGYGIGLVLLGALAKRLRRNSKVNLYNNLPDFFYGEHGALAGVTSTLLSFLAFFALLVLQFSAGTLVLTSLSPLPPVAAALLSAMIVIAYLVLSGYRGVILTDKIQLAVMVVGLPLLLILLLPGIRLGSAVVELKFAPLPTLATLLTGICVILGSGDIWQRMLGARDDPEARKGLIWAGLGFTVFGVILALIGIAAKLQNLTTDPDSAFIVAALSIENSFLSSIVVLTVFSALLSTADTETFLLSGIVAREVARWKAGLKSTAEASQQTSVPLSRWLIAAIALLASLVSLATDQLVYVYSILIYLLLSMAAPVFIGVFRRLQPTVVWMSMLLSASLLSLIPLGLLQLENAVLVALPGLALCILTPYRSHAQTSPTT